MSDSPRRLPARPSFEQLQKQAKDFIRQYRAGDPDAAERFRVARPSSAFTLADAQFVIAREYGFESWAKLKRHIEALLPPGISQYDRLAADLAAAYTSGDSMAIREVNWSYGTSFACDFHNGDIPQQRLKTWFAAESKTADLALDDARQMVAHYYGFRSWAALGDSVRQPPGDPRSAPLFLSSSPPFYTIDWKENRISIRGPQSDDDWNRIADVMKEHRISSLISGAMTDAGMERISMLEHVTHLQVMDSQALTDIGVRQIGRMPQLLGLEIGGWTSPITDRSLEVLGHLRELRRFETAWTRGITDIGVAHLASCDRLETVNLMGTPSGDGAIRALAGKSNLHQLHTGARVTDAGLPLLHEFPHFKTPLKTWTAGKVDLALVGQGSVPPNQLTIDGPFTDAGIASLRGLDGLFGLGFFWHCPAFTSAGLAGLRNLPNLQVLACEGKRCDDDAMSQIAGLPRLRKLMAQGTVATDAGFVRLSQSRTIEFIWGRECPNLTGRGFAALESMPALRGIAVSCKNVDDASLAALPRFPSLTQIMPMDVSDEGFRHIGGCTNLERLWCMYCRDTGDVATSHIAGLHKLTTYYAGMTKITDRSLEILAGMSSLERIELWQCVGITDMGIARLATLPRLRDITIDGSPNVSRAALPLFPSNVHVNYSG
jgi:hypothetical protein